MNQTICWQSQLEKDYCYYLEIDPKVVSYQSQPFRVAYLLDGKQYYYAPNFLVNRQDETYPTAIELNQVSKIKQPKNSQRLTIIRQILQQQAYHFQIITDDDIRVSPRLDNIKFLASFISQLTL